MYHFILNPTAGKGRSLSAMKKIQKYLDEKGIGYTVLNTASPCHATYLAEQLSEQKCQNIIAVGGDGTVNEALNGIADFENCRFGIVPCGTGNDFAKFIGLPKDPLDAMKLILKDETKYTDYIKINGARVMNVCGMGLDVTVLERCRRMKVFKGKLQYMISLLATLFRLKWYNYSVSIDGGEPLPRTALIIAAANGKYFGGGIPISPCSNIDDGKMNVIIINKLPKWKIPAILISLMRGKILKYSFVENIHCETFKITPEIPAKVNLDGELHENLNFDCKIVSNKLQLYR